MRTVMRMICRRRGNVVLGSISAQSDDLERRLLLFAEHFGFLLRLAQRDDVLGRLTGLRQGPLADVDDVTLVFVGM